MNIKRVMILLLCGLIGANIVSIILHFFPRSEIILLVFEMSALAIVAVFVLEYYFKINKEDLQ